MAKYPVRLIALGPPFDDGTVGVTRKPADARGATPPSNGLRTAAASGQARSTNRPAEDDNPDLLRQMGLVKLDNEVLRDVLEVAWTTITTLAPTGQNWAADALRTRIWAHLHDENMECPSCEHYVVNHEASGPCIVPDCDCQNTALPAAVGSEK
jgi:hypothetical protein